MDPLPQVAMRGLVAAWSDAIVPVGKQLHKALRDDAEHLARILAEIRPPCEATVDNVSQLTCIKRWSSDL